MSTLQAGEELAASVAVAKRITLADVEAAIVDTYFHVYKTLTICVLTTRNGFTVTGESACISVENFDKAVGEKFARDDAMRKLWGLEAYAHRSSQL